MTNPSRSEDREYLIGNPHPAFVDERGAITNIIDGVPLQHVAIITSKKGSVRGNHYHPVGQYIYIISGALQSFSRLPDSRYRSIFTTFISRTGDLLYCPPNVAHAYLAVEDTVFLNLDEGSRGPGTYSQDTTPCIVFTTGATIRP